MSTETPYFSIIIPTYNSEKYLEEALRSALAQTFSPIEIIVVDGHSKDGTRAITERVAKEDPRVQFVLQREKGPAQARNQGLELARGTFITFFDSDNLLLPTACETIKKKIDGGDSSDVFYSDLRYFEGDNKDTLTKFVLHYAPQVTLEELMKHNFINLLGTFIRKSTLDTIHGFDNRFRTCEEHILWFRLVLWANAKFTYIHTVLGHLRFHGTNLTWRPSYFVEAAETNFVMYDWLEGEFQEKVPKEERVLLQRALDRERAKWLFRAGLGGIIMKDRALARSYFKKWEEKTNKPKALRLGLDTLLLVAPLSLASPILRAIRRKTVMRKYVSA
jgi:glycosyltransferase involved in cell wall biosynthesis